MEDNITELETRLRLIEETAEKREIEEKLSEELKNYKGSDEVVSFLDIKDIPRVPAISSGLSKLDFLIEGFHEGDLIVISGPTGQGKTTMLQTFTINLSKQNVKSLWFSYEVTLVNLLRKFGDEMPDGYAPKILRENSIVWLERRIVEAIVKFKIKAVFVDPFNSLTKFTSNKLSQELGDLSEQLKQIALKYNIIVLVTAHAKRLTGNELIYTEDSIRDTALLGSKADTIMTLWRDKGGQKRKDFLENGISYLDTSTVSVVKNRLNGRIGFVKVIHHGNKFLLSDGSVQ